MALLNEVALPVYSREVIGPDGTKLAPQAASLRRQTKKVSVPLPCCQLHVPPFSRKCTHDCHAKLIEISVGKCLAVVKKKGYAALLDLQKKQNHLFQVILSPKNTDATINPWKQNTWS